MDDLSAGTATRLAEALIRIGAVAFSPEKPYTWASGLRAPIYCDNRLTMAYPPVRRMITEGFAERLAEMETAPEAIVGTATAGIPHAAWLAGRLDLPMAYVRSKPKTHGRGNRIEGRLASGSRVVIVEDLVSTGMSSVAVVEALRAAGVRVEAVLAIFSYGLPVARAAFTRAAVPLHTLTDFATLLEVARKSGALAPEAIASLESWRRDPEAWSRAHSEDDAA